MEDDLEFLKEFPKDDSGMFVVYDRFTFDNLFLLLLKDDFDHEDALMFMITNCSMSALVFQERIYNKKYRNLSAEDILPSYDAALRAKIICDLIQVTQN